MDRGAPQLCSTFEGVAAPHLEQGQGSLCPRAGRFLCSETSSLAPPDTFPSGSRCSSLSLTILSPAGTEEDLDRCLSLCWGKGTIEKGMGRGRNNHYGGETHPRLRGLEGPPPPSHPAPGTLCPSLHQLLVPGAGPPGLVLQDKARLRCESRGGRRAGPWECGACLAQLRELQAHDPPGKRIPRGLNRCSSGIRGQEPLPHARSHSSAPSRAVFLQAPL